MMTYGKGSIMKNGVYEEIDNTLIKEKTYYVNKANDYKIYFYKMYDRYYLKFVYHHT